MIKSLRVLTVLTALALVLGGCTAMVGSKKETITSIEGKPATVHIISQVDFVDMSIKDSIIAKLLERLDRVEQVVSTVGNTVVSEVITDAVDIPNIVEPMPVETSAITFDHFDRKGSPNHGFRNDTVLIGCKDWKFKTCSINGVAMQEHKPGTGDKGRQMFYVRGGDFAAGTIICDDVSFDVVSGDAPKCR